MFRKLFLVTALALVASSSAHALGTGRAAGTPVTPPKNPIANPAQCLSCHTTINKLHTRGAHKDVNCGSCHDVTAEHSKSPSAKNRPVTHFEYEACSQCHQEEHKDLMDPKYHYAWAQKKSEDTSYKFMRDNDNEYPNELQSSLPRFHSGILIDVATVRSDGRFQYKNPDDQFKPQSKLWDIVKDTRPEDGDDMKSGDVTSLTWRPHKGRGLMTVSYCLRCKSADYMMDVAYAGADVPGATFKRDSKPIPILKKVNNSFNCVYCHDPHSAEPRIIHDPLIATMTDPTLKDNPYQRNVGKPGMTPIEVIDMGVRGFTRKIGILKKYDSNYMCGQCHMSANQSLTLKDRTTGKGVTGGKPISGLSSKNMNMFAYGTSFSRDPLTMFNVYREKNLYNSIDKETGVMVGGSTTHPQVEMITQSVHGQNGVGCTDCHFAKKASGKLEHQPSLPLMKVQNTCMRSDCHGPGTKSNWQTPSQAFYAINTIQQKFRIRKDKWEWAGRDARDLLIKAKNGEVKIPEPQYTKLKDAYEKHLIGRDFYWSDYSKSMHDPSGFEKVSSQIINELKATTADAQKAVQKK